jgi:PKD repeat protein
MLLTKKKSALLFITILLTSWMIPTCFAQTATATISGIVKDRKGNPVAGAKVGLYRTPQKGQFIILLPIATGTTSASGTFSLTATFASASYYVFASKTGYDNERSDFSSVVTYILFVGYRATLTPNYLNIQMNHYPTVSINGPFSVEATDIINFSSSGSTDPDGTITQYFWDFGDGSNSSSANPSYSYQEPGNYTVTLTVTDDGGLANTATTTSLVSPKPPIANANGPYIGGATEPVSFSSEGSKDLDGEIIKFDWNFGDGSEHSFEPNPTHTYALQGNYTITLTVTDDDNVSISDTTWCDIAPRPPVPDINGPYEGITGQPIQFSSEGSYDIDGEIVEYRWNFGDGSGVYLEENPSHAFDDVGNFSITLTVEDNDGLAETVETYCIIELPPNILPQAEATGPNEGTAESPISFSSSGSSDTDGEIVEYLWDFGDGTTSTEANPTHTFEEEGTYTITLTVTDDRGDTAIDSYTLTVEPKPFPILLLAGAVLLIAGAVAAYYFLVFKKKGQKESKPKSLKIKVEPEELPSDGRSTAEITVEVLDQTNTPIKLKENKEVSLTTALGSIISPITITEGSSENKTTLKSGFEVGEAIISVESVGLKSASIKFSITEKKRYCMHCGAQMTEGTNICPKCGKSPPSGVDVRECNNCGEVIPIVARFCSNCGASQPKLDEETEKEE